MTVRFRFRVRFRVSARVRVRVRVRVSRVRVEFKVRVSWEPNQNKIDHSRIEMRGAWLTSGGTLNRRKLGSG